MKNSQTSSSLKKGFTLIEVVVALGILTLALVTTITLIVNVVNLAMVAKDKTEATSLVQKGLSDAVSSCMGCDNTTKLALPYVYINNTTKVSDTGEEDPGGHAATKYTLVSSNGMTNTIIFDQSFTAIPSESAPVDPAAFTKVISRVNWDLRGTPYSTTAIQYVRRNR